MINMKQKLSKLPTLFKLSNRVLISLVLFFSINQFVWGNQTSPVVNELKLIMKTNPDLKKDFEDAFAVQLKSSYWYGKSMDDMYQLFERWRVFNPKYENLREYVSRFATFYSKPRHRGNIPKAINVIRDERFVTWMAKFVKSRGEYLDSNASSIIVADFAKQKDINLGIYQIPQQGYQSFNQFFTRKLKPGVRPIQSPENNSIMTSPADCNIWEQSSKLTKDSTVSVKGRQFSVSKLLDDAEIAKRFIGGRAAICFLNPENYHRFHAPINATVSASKQLDGLYFGAKGFFSNFFEFRRAFYILDTKNSGSIGMVAVGIATISSVNMSKKTGDTVNKGDEIGFFAYGGSAIVLLFEPDQLQSAIYDKTENPYSYRSIGVSMGQEIGKLK